MRLHLSVCAIILSSTSLASAATLSISNKCREFRGMVALLDTHRIERPKPPSCATSSIGYDYEYLNIVCRTQLVEYRDAMKRYFECLKSEGDESVDEINSTIGKFNSALQAAP